MFVLSVEFSCTTEENGEEPEEENPKAILLGKPLAVILTVPGVVPAVATFTVSVAEPP